MKHTRKERYICHRFCPVFHVFRCRQRHFPSLWGLESGAQWVLGFICYYIADIGLALVALFAILHRGGS